MAKNMARLEDGIVINVEWCSDSTAETDILKEVGDRPVGIGDIYKEGYFWRDGEKILSEVEELRIANEILLNGLEVAE
jgi:hypothetical protein